jgi:probable HAF family extracellular repeat protein
MQSLTTATRSRTNILAIALLLTLAAPFPVTAQTEQAKQPLHYYVFNLGSPKGGASATAASINNAGWIAGSAFLFNNTTEHAELWLGTPHDLGTLGGPNSAVAWPNKNNKGAIAGVAETADMNKLGEDWSCALAIFATITHHVCLGFVWEDGVMTALPPFQGGLDSFATASNNRGQVVGWAENSVHESTCVYPQVLQFEAAIWGPDLGEMTELPPLSGDLDGAATAINDKGEVVGISGICDQAVGRFTAKHAVLWQSGVPINLGNFDGGKAWNTPTAMNNHTQIVGFANLPDTPSGDFNPVAFLWTREHKMEELLPLSGDSNDIAWGINDRGQVVGQSGNRAFLYQDGLMTDLNSLIQPDSSLNLELANDINDRGEIVGFALDTATNVTVAFLAVPVYGAGVPEVKSAVQSAVQTEGNTQRLSAPENSRLFLPVFGRFAPEGLK